jgi:hypothetical protein
VGFIESNDGGATWSPPVTLAGPFTNTWLPNTSQGYMVGDYNSASFANGRATSVFALANPGTCQLGQITTCDVPMAAPARPLAGAGATTPVGPAHPAPGARSYSVKGALKTAN